MLRTASHSFLFVTLIMCILAGCPKSSTLPAAAEAKARDSNEGFNLRSLRVHIASIPAGRSKSSAVPAAAEAEARGAGKGVSGPH